MTTGRYCPPRICWCGACAWWQPAPDPDYTRLREAAERATKKQMRAWARAARPEFTVDVDLPIGTP